MAAGTSTPDQTTWREYLERAMERHKHLEHHTHVQLATVRPDGRPANRTLVFRGFAEGCDKMQFITDLRSNKIEDIKHCPIGEICYYFPESCEQFRIQGHLDFISHTECLSPRQLLREKVWFDNPPKSADFLHYSPHRHPNSVRVSKRPQFDPTKGPIETFCVITLQPETVIYNHADVVHKTFRRDPVDDWTPVAEKLSPEPARPRSCS